MRACTASISSFEMVPSALSSILSNIRPIIGMASISAALTKPSASVSICAIMALARSALRPASAASRIAISSSADSLPSLSASACVNRAAWRAANSSLVIWPSLSASSSSKLGIPIMSPIGPRSATAAVEIVAPIKAITSAAAGLKLRVISCAPVVPGPACLPAPHDPQTPPLRLSVADFLQPRANPLRQSRPPGNCRFNFPPMRRYIWPQPTARPR